MKEGAENVERKIQAKVESLKNANEGDKGEWKTYFFIHRIQILFRDNFFADRTKRIFVLP